VSIKINRRELLKLTSSLITLPPAVHSAPAQANQFHPPGAAPIGFDSRIPISLAGVGGSRTSEGDVFLRPGETIHLETIAPQPLNDVQWRVRLVGEVDIEPQLHSEMRFDALYRVIDDALDREAARRQTYCLTMRSEGEAFPRRAYWRVVWSSEAPTRDYLLRIWAKNQQVEILPGGRLGVMVEVYRRRPARNQEDISGPADASYLLDVGAGTSDWRELRLPVRLAPDVACLLFTIVGEKFRGKVWLEDPQFPGPDGINTLPPFAPARPFAPFRNWVAQNLSRLEWPQLRLSINQQELFRGAVFQPIYRWPAWEVDIPFGVLHSGSNQLEVGLISDYHEPPGYKLRSVEWLGNPSGPVEVLACPKLVKAGTEFTVLISAREPNQRMSVEVLPRESGLATSIRPAAAEFSPPERGLHFVRFRADAAGGGGILRFRCGNAERRATVERIIEQSEDDILLGTSESFLIPQEIEAFRRFFTWYLHRELGNYTWFDVVYFWGGTRVCDPQAWREAVHLCERAGIKYSYMIDGRDINGMGSAPSKEMLAGPLFLGSFTIEQDGDFYYLFSEPWMRRRPGEELFWDIYLRYAAWDRTYYCNDRRLLGAGTMTPTFFNPDLTSDMREGAEYFVSNIRGNLDLGPWHCGPSTLFKYFFQAGFKRVDAELVYGPHEIILGALRGASLAYDQPEYGALLAIDWSTTPHDDPAFFRRYFLSLATCYIHGIKQIIMQNGAYHMESGLVAEDRFSPACQGTLKIHQEFYRFVRAHSRRGRMRVPVGFLQGQYDGWTCWERAKVWGQNAPGMSFGAPEKSWDLLKTFFPRSVLAPIYRFPCPHEPVGFFTGTPYGPADIVPIEASASALAAYRALILLGWNTADAEQLERLVRYVEAGGHLVLALPHLSTETERNRPPVPLAGSLVQKLLGLQVRGQVESSGEFASVQPEEEAWAETVRGRTLRLGEARLVEAEVRVRDGRGTPLLVENRVGRGRVTYVNAAAYPGEESLAPLYQEVLKSIGASTLSEEGQQAWVQGSEDVSFAVYDWEARAGKAQTSTIYLLNVNWWSGTPQRAEARLFWGGAEIPLEITRDRIHMITLSKEWGIWTEDLDTDVMEVQEEAGRAKIRLQGEGETRLTILRRPEPGRSASAKLCARTGRTSLRLERGLAPGVWQTRVTLNGPESLEISLCQ
jgi:hypothetical protein